MKIRNAFIFLAAVSLGAVMTQIDAATHMVVSDSPSYDIVQAMPLRTSRSQFSTVSGDSGSGYPQFAEFTLAPETRLVEVTVISQSGSDTVFAQLDGETDELDATDPDDATSLLMSGRIPIGGGFAKATYAVGKSDRKLRLIAIPPLSGEVGVTDVYVLEG